MTDRPPADPLPPLQPCCAALLARLPLHPATLDVALYDDTCLRVLDQRGLVKVHPLPVCEDAGPTWRAGRAGGVASVADIADAELLGRAVRSARDRVSRKGAAHPRWVAVMDSFGLGSTYARQLCARFGLDPYEQVRR